MSLFTQMLNDPKKKPQQQSQSGGGQKPSPGAVHYVQHKNPAPQLTLKQYAMGIGVLVTGVLVVFAIIALTMIIIPHLALIGLVVLGLIGLAVGILFFHGARFVGAFFNAKINKLKHEGNIVPQQVYYDNGTSILALPAVDKFGANVQHIHRQQPLVKELPMAIPQQSQMLVQKPIERSQPIVSRPVQQEPIRQPIRQDDLIVRPSIQKPIMDDDEEEIEENNEQVEGEYAVMSKSAIIQQLNKLQFPEAPLFQKLNIPSIISTGKMMFGTVLDPNVGEKHLIGTMNNAYSILIAGLPGRGKSTLEFFFIAQFIGMGAEIWIFDPHAQLIALKKEKVFQYEHDVETMCMKTLLILEIFKKRKLEYIEHKERGVEYKPKLFLFVIDEMPVIAEDEKEYEDISKKVGTPFYSIKRLLRKIVNEGRKYNMFAIVAGQSFPATVLPTSIRDNFTSKYVFYTEPGQARMVGLSAEARKRLLPKLQPLDAKGLCIATIPGLLPEAGIVDIADTKVDDIKIMIAHKQGKVVEADIAVQPTRVIAPRKSIPLAIESEELLFVDVPGLDRTIPRSLLNDFEEAIKKGEATKREDLYPLMPQGFKNRDVSRQVINAVCAWKGWFKQQDRVMIVPSKKEDEAEPEDETKRM